MSTEIKGRVAILYPDDREARKNATPDNNRLAPMFRALVDVGLQAEPVVYHDDFSEEVRQQPRAVDAMLVWMIHLLDKEAKRLGVPRQSIIKIWLAERLEKLSA